MLGVILGNLLILFVFIDVDLLLKIGDNIDRDKGKEVSKMKLIIKIECEEGENIESIIEDLVRVFNDTKFEDIQFVF